MRYFIDEHGCAKNQVDAESLMALLGQTGWESVADIQDADLIIVNSCGFIESAKEESLEAVFALRQAFPDKKILLGGCLAQRYGQDLLNDLLEADSFFGNTDLSLISEAAQRTMGGERFVLIPPKPSADIVPLAASRPLLSMVPSAYIKITEGCNNNCTYCAIPLIRGTLRSRPIAEIVVEAKALLARGVRELCLVGQDLGSYGTDFTSESQLAALLAALLEIDATFWIRMLYIHPDRFPLDILPVCQKDARVLPYFDLPFQHASPAILKAMNRRGTPETYLALLQTIRSALPDAVLRSTFLLGFPGETEEDIEVLLDFQQKAALDWVGAFSYSREEDTPAYNLKGRVAKKIADARRARVENAQVPITESAMRRFVGRELDVLVEETVEGEDGLYLGRTFCQAPEVDGSTVINSDSELIPGSVLRARIIRCNGFDLEAVGAGH